MCLRSGGATTKGTINVSLGRAVQPADDSLCFRHMALNLDDHKLDQNNQGDRAHDEADDSE